MKFRFITCFVVWLGLSILPARAESDIWFSPTPAIEFTSPQLFSGAYAGVSVGLQAANKATFYATGTDFLFSGTVFAGYNHTVAPWLVVGVEAQLDAAYDPWNGVSGYNLFGLGRVGVLTSPNLMIYEIGGLGVINGTAALAMGVGWEQAVYDNMSVRYELINYGQIPGMTNGQPYYGGFTSLELSVGALWYLEGSSSGAGWHEDRGTDPKTNFVGPYLGHYVGGVFDFNYAYFVGNNFNGYHPSNFAQGAIAGWNFDLGGPIRGGVEAQGGIHHDTSGDVGLEGQLLGRVGLVPMEGMLVYATAGGGYMAQHPSYVLGGGVEYAVWGDSSLRLDVQTMGQFSPLKPSNSGLIASKVTVGTIWHLD